MEIVCKRVDHSTVGRGGGVACSWRCTEYLARVGSCESVVRFLAWFIPYPASGDLSSARLKFRMKIGFVSLGCPKNLVDSEVMMGLLEARGHQLTTVPEEAEATEAEAAEAESTEPEAAAETSGEAEEAAEETAEEAEATGEEDKKSAD